MIVSFIIEKLLLLLQIWNYAINNTTIKNYLLISKSKYIFYLIFIKVAIYNIDERVIRT